MPLDATKPEGIIAYLDRRTDAAGMAARAAMLRFTQQKAAPAVLTLAQQKAPLLWNNLKVSGHDRPTRDGAIVAFGGGASRYAAQIHEEAGRLKGHIGRGKPRSGPYVYGGTGVTVSSRGSGSGNPGEWNEPKKWGPGTKGRITAWANRITAHRPFYGGAKGSDLIEWAGHKWRFKKASYAKRDRASAHPKQGQPHFLFGAENSAYAEKRSWIVRQLAKVGLRAAGEAARAR